MVEVAVALGNRKTLKVKAQDLRVMGGSDPVSGVEDQLVSSISRYAEKPCSPRMAGAIVAVFSQSVMSLTDLQRMFSQ